MKRVIMIAYHFPPLSGSSGIQRTLRFARYLPEFGWQPIVLTAHPRAYDRVSDDLVQDVPEGVRVIRAPAWDASRHFALAGRYPAMLARPDRWVSWWPGAVMWGSRAIRRYRPHAIWSTYPIATAHMIGCSLARRNRLPFVADFRDPMAQPGYPTDPAVWQRFAEIERDTINLARFSTFTTPSAVQTYQQRYPGRSERISLLENGFDEESFAEIASPGPLNPGRITLLHSGLVYPSERDPNCLFDALARLKATRRAIYDQIVVRFRAPVHEQLLRELASRHGVEDCIEIKLPIGYREALGEMFAADGLLVLQAANCNEQVPAKLYEYFRAARPILVLSDPAGDTACIARNAGIETIAPLEDAAAIYRMLEAFMTDPLSGTLPRQDATRSASRRQRTAQLAALLDGAIAQ